MMLMVASPSGVEAAATDDAYLYPADDSALRCLPFASHGGQRHLTLADLEHQLADDAELGLWRSTQAFFSALPTRAAYLDIGCGTGRIIGLFGGNFQNLTCLEADFGRLRLARSSWAGNKWGRTEEAQFVNTRFMNYLPPQGHDMFDAISCIHVIQHIPQYELERWLMQMHALLKPRGVLVLATKHRETEVFQLENNKHVSQREFDTYAFAAKAGGPLAVRSFSSASLSRLVGAAGFHVWMQGYTTIDSTGADSMYIVAGKSLPSETWLEKAKYRAESLPLSEVHATAQLKRLRKLDRRACKTPCKGKGKGWTPGDYLC